MRGNSKTLVYFNNNKKKKKMWGLFEIKAFFNRVTIDQHQTFPKYSYTTMYFADYCSWLLFFIGTQAFYRLSFSYAGCKYKLESLPKKSQMKTFLKSRGDLKPCWKTCSRAQTRPYSPQSRRVRLPLCGESKNTCMHLELISSCLKIADCFFLKMPI